MQSMQDCMTRDQTLAKSVVADKKRLLRASCLWSKVVALALARCVFYCFLIIARLLPGRIYWSRQAASVLNAYEADTSCASTAAATWGWSLGDLCWPVWKMAFVLHACQRNQGDGFLDKDGWSMCYLVLFSDEWITYSDIIITGACRFFWHFIDKTVNGLTYKITNKVTDNEYCIFNCSPYMVTFMQSFQNTGSLRKFCTVLVSHRLNSGW